MSLKKRQIHRQPPDPTVTVAEWVNILKLKMKRASRFDWISIVTVSVEASEEFDQHRPDLER
ncbi:MAG TPA: hypothetical protein VGX00_05280 [Thermoplasmata archaeon]|nr:hypothetical protein [Thermoplasmata archaeon]